MRIFWVLLFIAAPTFAFAASPDPNDLSLFPMTLKMLAALGVVIGLFLLLYALARKSRTWLPGAAAQDSINVRAVRHLGPKRALYVVEVDGRRFFISAAGEQIRLLSEWEAPHLDPEAVHKATDGTVAPHVAPKSPFAQLLQRQFKAKKHFVAGTNSKNAAASSPQSTPIQPASPTDTPAESQEDKSCSEV